MKCTICFMAFILALLSCSKNTDIEEVIDKTDQNSVTMTAAQYEAAGVQIGQVQCRPLSRKLQVNGMLDVPPQNMAIISAPMGGFVKSTQLLQGMKVKKGEVLVTLENQEYIRLQQDYLENLSKLEFALAEYERQQVLAKENVNSQKTLQQAKSQYEIVSANVKGLEARLLMLNIKPAALRDGNIRSVIQLNSPMDGFVTQVNVTNGQFVNGTDAMFKIVSLKHIHLELQVYEKDIRALKIGQKITFQLVNDPQSKTASVYLIGKEISPDRTIRVHCHLGEEDQRLLPGMFATAMIETETVIARVVPDEAIVSFEAQNIVFVPSGERQYKAINVKTGGQSEEYTEILPMEEELREGDSIVVKGAFELLGLIQNE